MAVTSQQDDDIISGINVTPLVDIILVVLIIFIVTASLVLRHNIPVELPQAQTGEQSVDGLPALEVLTLSPLLLGHLGFTIWHSAHGRPVTADYG